MVRIYTERITSLGTSLLFLCLSLLFFLISSWRISLVGWRFFPGLFAFLGLFFAFYVINYRVLQISISSHQLILKFGIITWKSSLDNVQDCRLDDSPALIKYGGAGVHLAFVKGTYRVFFNFLEYPRVVVRLIKKQGPVQELVLTTRHPDQVLQILQSHKRQP